MNNAERAEYRARMEAKLTKLKADVLRMEGEAKEVEADVRLDIHRQLQRLRRHSEDVRARIDGLKTASEGAWSEAKSGVAKAWAELESAFEKARAEMKHTSIGAGPPAES